MSKLFLKKDITRNRTMRIRVTPDEEILIQQKADDAGFPYSEYLRRCALGRSTRSRVQATIINELRQFASLIKRMRADQVGEGAAGTEWDNEYRLVLLSAVEAIERIGLKQDVSP